MLTQYLKSNFSLVEAIFFRCLKKIAAEKSTRFQPQADAAEACELLRQAKVFVDEDERCSKPGVVDNQTHTYIYVISYVYIISNRSLLLYAYPYDIPIIPPAFRPCILQAVPFFGAAKDARGEVRLY